jgi:hypothetical protein
MHQHHPHANTPSPADGNGHQQQQQPLFTYPRMQDSIASVVQILESGYKEEIQIAMHKFDEVVVEAQGLMRRAHEVMDSAHREYTAGIHRLLQTVQPENANTQENNSSRQNPPSPDDETRGVPMPQEPHVQVEL